MTHVLLIMVSLVTLTSGISMLINSLRLRREIKKWKDSLKYLLTFLLISFPCYAQEIQNINLHCGNAFSEALPGEEKNDVYEIPRKDILEMSAKELARLNHVMIVFTMNNSGYFRAPVPKSLCSEFINKKYLKK